MTPGFRSTPICRYCKSTNLYLLLEVKESCRYYSCRVCYDDIYVKLSVENIYDRKERI